RCGTSPIRARRGRRWRPGRRSAAPSSIPPPSAGATPRCPILAWCPPRCSAGGGKGVGGGAGAMREGCARGASPADNPGLRLGAALAGFAREGRDKVTLIFSEKLRALGPWIEQLLAESLG